MSLQMANGKGSRGEWEERLEFEVRGEVEDGDAYSDEELSVNNWILGTLPFKAARCCCSR